MIYQGNIIDAHVHILNSHEGIGRISDQKKQFGYGTVNALSIEGYGDPVQNAICMLFKALSPGDYAFGGLWYGGEDEQNHLEQVRFLHKTGFDGMKMIEGKPDVRRKIGKPLDDPSYAGFYAYLEEHGLPLLLHAADPETFWDENLTPAWAKANGWFYGNGEYPSKEQICSEVEGVLKQFGNLKMILAHFYFMSANVKRAADFMETYPNVSIDITPGTEMYTNFSVNPSGWREFFIHYQDRVIFGTDNYDAAGQTEADNMLITNQLMHRFLQSKGKFKAWDLELCGIDLPVDVLEKIYNGNFLRMVQKQPRTLNFDAAEAYCDQRLAHATEFQLNDNHIRHLRSIKEKLRQIR